MTKNSSNDAFNSSNEKKVVQMSKTIIIAFKFIETISFLMSTKLVQMNQKIVRMSKTIV